MAQQGVSESQFQEILDQLEKMVNDAYAPLHMKLRVHGYLTKEERITMSSSSSDSFSLQNIPKDQPMAAPTTMAIPFAIPPKKVEPMPQEVAAIKVQQLPLETIEYQVKQEERCQEVQIPKTEQISLAELVPKQNCELIKEASNDETSCAKLESSMDKAIVEIEEPKFIEILPNNQVSPTVDDPSIVHLISTNYVLEESIERLQHKSNLERMEISVEEPKAAQYLKTNHKAWTSNDATQF